MNAPPSPTTPSLTTLGDQVHLWPLDLDDLSAAGSEDAGQLMSTAFRPTEVVRWSLVDVSPDPARELDFRATLAIEGPPPDCHYFQLRLTPRISDNDPWN